MEYWWVNQGHTYAAERQGGYLWAPRSGHHHHERMAEIHADDVIFSYVHRHIVAVSVAMSDTEHGDRPEELRGDDAWGRAGYRALVDYHDVDPHLSIPSVVDSLRPLLPVKPAKYSPLDVNDEGNQGYLYPLPQDAGDFLLNAVSPFLVPGVERRFRHGGSATTLSAIVDADVTALEAEWTGIEGGSTSALVNKYERDRHLREAAITIHGKICMACGFDFRKTYGPHGQDFIEVHHVRPLFTLGGDTVVIPQTDMVVLCANCHRMVHRKLNDPLSLKAVRKLLVENA